MYIATPAKAHKPWFVPQLNTYYYTFEGVVTSLYENLNYYLPYIENGLLLRWVKDQLGMEDLCNELDQVGRDLGVLHVLERLLLGSDYTSTLAFEPLKEAYDLYQSSSSTSHYKYLGDEALKGGRYLEAVKHYKKVMAIGYEVEVGNNLGIAYMALENYDMAMKMINRCISHDGSMDYRLNRVKLNRQVDNYQGMLEDLSHLSGLYEDSKVWYYYGVAYEGLIRNEEAMAAYIRALEGSIEEGYLMAFITLAIKENQLQLVELWLSEHELSEEMSAYVQGQVSRAKGDILSYIHQMEKVIGLNPKELTPIFELIQYYVDEGQIIKAVEYMGIIPKEFQSMEQVCYYKVIISSAAGNRKEFNDQVNGLINKWKNEARMATV